MPAYDGNPSTDDPRELGINRRTGMPMLSIGRPITAAEVAALLDEDD